MEKGELINRLKEVFTGLETQCTIEMEASVVGVYYWCQILENLIDEIIEE